MPTATTHMNGQQDNQRVDFDPRNPLKLKKKKEKPENDTEALLTQDVDDRSRSKSRMQIKLDFNSDTSDEENEKTRDKEEEDDDMFEDEKKADQLNEFAETDGSIKLMDMKEFETKTEIEDGNKNVLYDIYTENDSDQSDDNLDEVTAENTDIKYFIDPDETERTSRAKTQEPKLEAFNLKSDLDEGNFDTEGNFIRNSADDQAHQDEWLTGYNKRDINAAKNAQQKREQEENRRKTQTKLSKPEMIAELCRILSIGDTPLDALQQLNKKKPAKKSKNGKRPSHDTDNDLMNNEQEKKRKELVEKITELTDELSNNGMLDIYEMTREELMRIYQRETGHSFIDLKRKRSLSPSNEIEWEFRWNEADEIHGPYSTEDMRSWIEQGYFQQQVMVRERGKKAFKNIDEVSFN